MTDQTNTTDLERRDPYLADQIMDRPLMDAGEINTTWRIAKALAQSGMFKDAIKAEQAFAKILLGRDLGMSPTEAMTSIDLIEGKPEVNANWQAGKIRRTPGYNYKVVRLDAQGCEIEYFLNGESVGVSSFTVEDAKLAGLEQKKGKGGSPGMYQKYPRNMLWARAMSNGVHFYIPEIMHGIRVYSPGEIETLGMDPREPDEKPQALPENMPRRLDVQGVIEQAREVGHAGLSDLPTIAMLLDSQPVEYVTQWIDRARSELEGMVPAEAEVVPEDLIPAPTPEPTTLDEEA